MCDVFVCSTNGINNPPVSAEIFVRDFAKYLIQMFCISSQADTLPGKQATRAYLRHQGYFGFS
jgi:hypothetical protein